MADANFLTNKLGPLPTYGWIGLAVAGIVGYTRFVKKKTTTPSGGIDPNTGAPLDALVTSASPIANVAQTPVAANIEPGPNPFVAPIPNTPHSLATNQEWLATVENFLTSQGADPTQAITGLSNYLAGTYVSPAQLNYVNQGIAQFGPTPEGAIVPNVTPPAPAPAPAPTPVAAPVAPAAAAPRVLAPKIGETWGQLATRAGISVAQLIQLNNSPNGVVKATKFKTTNPVRVG